MRNKHKNKIREVLTRAAGRFGWADTTEDSIDRWLVKNENDTTHKDVMAEMFNTGPAISRKPSEEALSTLQIVKRRLGFTSMKPYFRTPLYRRTYFHVASAAAVMLIAAGGVLTMLDKKDVLLQPVQVAQITQEAVDDVNKDVFLPDGSHVWINEHSELTYPEQFGEERQVRLKGQARFDVRHDSEHQFCVKTEYLEVRVLGTNFEIREYSGTDCAEVVLYEGLVSVTVENRTEKLRPGERLTYNHVSGEVTVENIDLQTQNDWRTETILAYEKTIPELLDMVSNYYNTPIRYSPGRFTDGKRIVVGFDKRDPIERVMQVISEVCGGVEYEISDDSTKTIYIK